MKSIEIWTDGSGTTKDKSAGYGWVMIVDGVKHSEGSGTLIGTNNDAEAAGAIAGLTAVSNLVFCAALDLDSGSPSSQLVLPEITLVSDSEIILGWASGKYAFKQQDKIATYNELRRLMSALRAQTRWVKGHSGVETNMRCDKLANQARLSLTQKEEIKEAKAKGTSQIGDRKKGTVCLWYKEKLLVVDLENKIIEDYSREEHGPRGSILEIREERNR